MIYEKRDLNKVGQILKNSDSSDEEINKAMTILKDWRARHSYPLHIFQMTLKNVSKKYDENALTAQRLKRVTSIIYKLNRKYEGREPTMHLSQMQDIAGCRAIVEDVSTAKKICNEYYLSGDLKHKRVGYKDYIASPKKDGYRSLHIVYEYKSDKGKSDYNDLKIEVQVRSKLQHLWATAIETVDFFTRQAIKFNEGIPDWADFFKLVSSAFAINEKCPIVEGTPADKEELYSQIKSKEKSLEVIHRMEGWTHAMKVFNEEVRTKMKGKAKFFLLELDILGGKLNIRAYRQIQESQAIKDYSDLEERHSGRKDYDVVLVGAETPKELKKAYPNYFVDTQDFIVELKKIISKVK